MANSFFIEQNADALPLYRLPIQCNATSYFLQELYVIILGLKNEQDVEQKSERGNLTFSMRNKQKKKTFMKIRELLLGQENVSGTMLPVVHMKYNIGFLMYLT